MHAFSANYLLIQSADLKVENINHQESPAVEQNNVPADHDVLTCRWRLRLIPLQVSTTPGRE
jgi:hypothetical protein